MRGLWKRERRKRGSKKKGTKQRRGSYIYMYTHTQFAVQYVSDWSSHTWSRSSMGVAHRAHMYSGAAFHTVQESFQSQVEKVGCHLQNGIWGSSHSLGSNSRGTAHPYGYNGLEDPRALVELQQRASTSLWSCRNKIPSTGDLKFKAAVVSEREAMVQLHLPQRKHLGWIYLHTKLDSFVNAMALTCIFRRRSTLLTHTSTPDLVRTSTSLDVLHLIHLFSVKNWGCNFWAL